MLGVLQVSGVMDHCDVRVVIPYRTPLGATTVDFDPGLKKTPTEVSFTTCLQNLSPLICCRHCSLFAFFETS
jgi:hypothetical protein